LYDVAVIGAGVSGAAIARELSRYRLKTVILEKAADVATGASKANSAIVHAGFDCTPGTLMARLNVQGSFMMQALCRELSVPYKPIGSLVIAFSPEDVQELHRLKQKGETNGVPGLEILPDEEVRRREPNVSPDVVAALWAPSAAITCPYELTLALVENAIANGAELRLGFSVSGMDRRDGLFIVQSAAGESVEARFVVNAAGLYADEVNALAGGRPFAIRPRKGEYMMLDRTAGSTVGTVVFQTPCKWGKGVLVSPTVDGNVYTGPTAMNITDKRDTATTPEGMWYLKRLSKKSVPGLALSKSITAFSGLRAVAAGVGDFIIGCEPGAPGFVNAAGMCSPGLSSSPAVAQFTVKELGLAGLKLEKKEDFNPVRPHAKPFREMDDAERREAIRRDSRYAHIVCRCETITEAEIVAAIHSPIPAVTMDGIKRRTRAQMGRCQGGFCGPRILEIISRETGLAMEEITKSGEGSWLVTAKEAGKC
jgi:glycerol-3-phosphate dehydrogenase